VLLGGEVIPSAGYLYYKGIPRLFIEYPATWNKIDNVRLDSLRSQFNQNTNSFSAEYRRVFEDLLKKVENGQLYVVFYDGLNTKDLMAVDVTMIPASPKISNGLASELRKVKQRRINTGGMDTVQSEARIHELNGRKILILQETYAKKADPLKLKACYLLIPGFNRSFLLSFTADSDQYTKLLPLVMRIAGSIKENQQPAQSLLNLPTWIEIGVIVLLAFIIVVLARKVISDLNQKPRSRHAYRRSGFPFAMVPAVIIVSMLLFLASMFFKSCNQKETFPNTKVRDRYIHPVK